MKLTRLGILLLIIWFSLALAEAIWRVFDYQQTHHLHQSILADIWQYSGLFLIALFLLEFLSFSGIGQISVRRNLSSTLAVNVKTEVSLALSHQLARKLTMEIYDYLPETCLWWQLPARLVLDKGQRGEVSYTIKPVERGPLKIETTEIWVLSRLGLLNKRVLIDCKSEVKVYPNYRSIQNYVLLATEQKTRQMGIRQRQKRGEGMDFHQLREYRMGDSLRQIDWRATSRLSRLISKEYQQERDQNIVFLLDAGRRMRAKDGALSHFDQALNATLLVSYIALKQGDAVGLKTFGGEDRWLPPKKGPGSINALLNQVYDLYPTNQASDLVRTAEAMNKMFTKRSLIVIVSNVRSEDESELKMAVAMLKKHHLVMLANMREAVLDEILDEDVSNFKGALTFGQTLDYMKERELLHRKLNHDGVIAVDSVPKQLAVNMVNNYFDVKRSGRL